MLSNVCSWIETRFIKDEILKDMK